MKRLLLIEADHSRVITRERLEIRICNRTDEFRNAIPR